VSEEPQASCPRRLQHQVIESFGIALAKRVQSPEVGLPPLARSAQSSQARFLRCWPSSAAKTGLLLTSQRHESAPPNGREADLRGCPSTTTLSY
jgi:hypothetical protein